MNFGKDAILCYLSLVLSYPGPHQEAWYHVAAWGLATTCDMGKEHGDPVVLSRVAAAVHSIPGCLEHDHFTIFTWARQPHLIRYVNSRGKSYAVL